MPPRCRPLQGTAFSASHVVCSAWCVRTVRCVRTEACRPRLRFGCTSLPPHPPDRRASRAPWVEVLSATQFLALSHAWAMDDVVVAMRPSPGAASAHIAPCRDCRGVAAAGASDAGTPTLSAASGRCFQRAPPGLLGMVCAHCVVRAI